MSNLLSKLALVVVCGLATTSAHSAVAAEIRLGVFDVDATPPVGSPLAYDPAKGSQGTLRFKGLVLVGDDEPIVLAAVDWIGIGGEGHDEVREALAKAVGTSVERVAVHALHQHDAPRFDMGAERILAEVGLGGKMFNVAWSRKVIADAAKSAKQAIEEARVVTHVALGKVKVEKVASNRRILGPDGKVIVTRYTATRDPKVRAYPEGPIDPWLRSIAFHSGDDLIAVATWYATHPQSYYRTGLANADFPGLAREARQTTVGVPHVHFNGAGGNIGAGKYNDGSHENRAVLASRVEKGMQLAFEQGERSGRQPVEADDLGWRTTKVLLPLGEHVTEEMTRSVVENVNEKVEARVQAAKALALVERSRANVKTDITCLRLGQARIVHMPGELFVEYQLAAQELRPDLFVGMAAYGDYAPGYIGTAIAYGQGGYESSERASRVAPGVEKVLVDAMRTVLESDRDLGPLGVPPFDYTAK